MNILHIPSSRHLDRNRRCQSLANPPTDWIWTLLSKTPTHHQHTACPNRVLLKTYPAYVKPTTSHPATWGREQRLLIRWQCCLHARRCRVLVDRKTGPSLFDRFCLCKGGSGGWTYCLYVRLFGCLKTGHSIVTIVGSYCVHEVRWFSGCLNSDWHDEGQQLWS